MSPKEYTLALIATVFLPVFSAITAWILARRKNSAELENLELGNIEKHIAIYKGIADDLKGEIEILRVEIHRLRVENLDLKNKIDTLTSRMNAPR